MKKVLLSLFLLNCITIIFAQEWAPIGAKWTYTLSFAFSSTLDTSTIRSIGDTAIQGKNCKIMIKNGGTCSDRPLIEYTYADSGRVFFFDPSRNGFQMLFNINAGIGDKFKIYPESSPNNDSIVIVVDSVSTITINSIVLKKLYVHKTNPGGNWVFTGGIIIENIGDTHYLYPWIYAACDAEFAGPLRCYEDSLMGFHDFGTAPGCDYTYIGIDEKNKMTNYSLSPNPFASSTQITLDKTYHDISLSVYDIQGKLMLQKQYADCNQIQLNRDGLSNGMYFLKLRLDEKGVETGKIVVSE